MCEGKSTEIIELIFSHRVDPKVKFPHYYSYFLAIPSSSFWDMALRTETPKIQKFKATGTR